MDTVRRYFEQTFPSLSSEDVASVLAIARAVHFERGACFVRAGERKREIAWVLRGLIRAYYIKESGQEMTPFFWAENEIVASWESIYLGRVSQLNFEAVEDTDLLLIDFPALKKLVDERDAIRRAYMEMMEVILTNTLVHTQSVKNEKPEDRYQHFLRDEPALVARLSQKHLASYLGITPISFSRMKKRMGL